ncbi:MAG: hypothetical protein KAU03_02525 [Candidatus Altiarchaeales archaeon]|nr:hypothetical protein [Candidatus Altiarchaeales archaeon]
MDSVRVNVLLPEKLMKEAKALVEKGYFSNFSEVVREGLRREVLSYRFGLGEMTEKDRMLLGWIKQEEAAGNLLSEEDMQKYGLRL